MNRIYFLLFLAPVLLGSSRIINGLPVEKADHGYWQTVRVLEFSPHSKSWVPNCTGTIVASDLILTAAHCLQGRSLENILIAYEAQPLSLDSQENPKTAVDVLAEFKTSQIDGWVSDPLYGTTDYDHDLALIKIDGIVPEGFSIAQILPRLYMDQISYGETYEVELLGYGLLSDSPRVESEILRKTRVPAVFEGMHLITDQTKGSGGCQGDSGGPAYLKLGSEYYLVGVTHGASKDSKNCRKRGVWVNPAVETQFLNDAAESLNSKAQF